MNTPIYDNFIITETENPKLIPIDILISMILNEEHFNILN